MLLKFGIQWKEDGILDGILRKIMTDLYFAYGSNMSATRLAERLGEARPLGRAQLAHFELAWNKPGADGSGKANVCARVGTSTWGVLFALEEREWPLLDRFELGLFLGRFLLGIERSVEHELLR